MAVQPNPNPHWIAVFRSRMDSQGVEARLVEVARDSVTIDTGEQQVTYEHVDTGALRRALSLGGYRPGETPTVWVQDRWRLIRLPLPSGQGTYLLSTSGARRSVGL